LPQRQKKKKTKTAAAISQCSNNKPQKKEPINRSPVPLSRLHSTRTIHTSRNLTDSEKKKDRSPDLLTTTGFVAAKTKLRDDACQPAAKIVFQNGLKTKTDRKKKKKVKKIHSTSVYRKLLKPDHKRNQQQRKHNDV
jgi:hypothetical protein